MFGRLDWLSRCSIACACLAAAACQSGSAEPVYTLPAGTVDARPVLALGPPDRDVRPELRGLISDPAKGRPVQVYADETIGGHVADFVAYHQVRGYSARFLYFYPAAAAGAGPGLCRSRVYRANGLVDDKDDTPGLRGSWEPDAYAVAGSVAPLARPWPANYSARLEAACAARRDMGYWYRAPPGKAYLSARLADSVIASAGRRGALPFRLSCRPFPPDMAKQPRCWGSVRKDVAAMNPRAILSVYECPGPARPPCLAINLPKFPERSRGDAEEEELWTLNVEYRDEGELRIDKVVVADDKLIIH
jgi:hypothetical protein